MNEVGEEGHCELGYFEDDMRDFSGNTKLKMMNVYH